MNVRRHIFSAIIVALTYCISVEAQQRWVVEAATGYAAIVADKGTLADWSNGWFAGIGVSRRFSESAGLFFNLSHSQFAFEGRPSALITEDTVAYRITYSGEISRANEALIEFRTEKLLENLKIFFSVGWGVRSLSIGAVTQSTFLDSVLTAPVSQTTLPGTNRSVLKGIMMAGGGVLVPLSRRFAVSIGARYKNSLDFEAPIVQVESRFSYLF